MISQNHRNKLKNCQGMTLVEVLLSLAILGIMSVLVSGVFINGMGLINRAGDLNKTDYKAAQDAENALAAGVKDGDLRSTIEITFPDKVISIDGTKKMIPASGSKNQVTIEVFIPNEED